MTTVEMMVPPEMVASGHGVAEVRLSPDGTALGFIQRVGSVGELLIRSLAGTGRSPGIDLVVTAAFPIASPHPDGGGAWTWLPDSSGVIFVGKDRGLWTVSATGQRPTQVVAPRTSGEQIWSPAISEDGRLVAFVVETNEASQLFVALIGRDSTTGQIAVQIAGPEGAMTDGVRTESFLLDPSWGPNGLLAWHSWSVPDMAWDGGTIELARVVLTSEGSSECVSGIGVAARGALSGLGSVGQPRFAPHRTVPEGPEAGRADVGRVEAAQVEVPRIGFVSDASGWKNVCVAEISELEGVLTGSKVAFLDDEHEHGEPTWGPGQRSFAWLDADTVVVDRNIEGFGLLAAGRLGHVGSDSAPELSTVSRGVHRSVSAARCAGGLYRVACIRQGATTPTAVTLFESKTSQTEAELESGPHEFTRRIIARGPAGGWDGIAVEPTLIRWKSADGAEVFGRLYRPNRPTDRSGPLATLVSVHGGPTGQTRVSWNQRFLSALAKGWQVFVPDYRGSTGWGRSYQAALNEGWGVVDVADCSAGVQHLIEAGLADPSAIVVSGGSAGGFTVLHLLAQFPHLFAAGINLYGVTDLLALDETTHRFEGHYQRRLVGQRPEHDQRYVDRSPITVAAKIAAPLLVLQGTNDKSVVLAQSEALVAVAREAGVEVEFVVYEGEGHGWSKPETTIDEQRRVNALLDRIWSAEPVAGQLPS